MLDSSRAIKRYLAGISHESFLTDMEKQDAVLRRFEIIGEIAGRLAPETIRRVPGLPFRAMRGMKNIIAYDYGEVDLELVWWSATHDLDPLIEAVDLHFS